MLMQDQNRMSRSNLEQEDAWIQAWSELYELCEGEHGVEYMTPNAQSLSQQEALAWLQDSAYKGMAVSVERTKVRGRVIIQLWRAKV